MKNKAKQRYVLFMLFVLALTLSGLIQRAEAQEPMNTSGKFKVELAGFIGWGTDRIKTGTSAEGDDITISAGGGLGAALTAGYGLSSKLDVDISYGLQESSLSPRPEHGSGDFDRTFALATVKYKIPTTGTTQWKLGAGVGLYRSGKLDLDWRSLPVGSRYVINYDNAVGFHVSGEYEIAITKNLYSTLGLKYYHVTYSANSVSQNGIELPVSSLRSEYRDLDGGGIDFFYALGMYF